ncbi:hypothetical protein EST38_g14024 [Candolleomyces aberdarensis]|uniref:CHAT domain-containing protein n=1 Tax=Candolleomyces aberdarensis TaxID=2316362 RepID=A0A4Q2D0S3_9AGAR|nr:hypothetical protein EST38_g14024 [Candolleomyces aberdarensis]
MTELPLLTPESLLFAIAGDSDNDGDDIFGTKCLSEKMSAAIVLTAGLSHYLTTDGADPEAMLTALGWGMEELFVDIEQRSGCNGSSTSSFNDLTLVVIGISDDDLDPPSRFSLTRVSDTRWKCETLIELTGEILPYLTVVVESLDVGDLGQATFSGEELQCNVSGSSDSGDVKVITKSMVDEEDVDASYDIGLSFVVRAMLSRKTTMVAAANQPPSGESLLERATDHCDLYEETEDPAELDEAISDFREALTQIPNGDLSRLYGLAGLAASLRHRHRITNDPADLDEMINTLEEDIALRAAEVPEDHDTLLIALAHLREASRARYRNLGNILDIDRAIDAQYQMIDIGSEMSNSMASNSMAANIVNDSMANMWSNLGAMLSRRFDHLGNTEDINKSIEAHGVSLSMMSGENDILMNDALCTLAYSYLSRFNRTGVDEDLEQAVSLYREAFEKQPEDSNILCNLGGCLMRKFERHGDLTDINEAISFQQKALQYLNKDIARYSALNNLALSFLYRYNHSRDVESLQEARINFELALGKTPKDHPTRPFTLTGLSICYGSLYERTRDTVQIYRAGAVQLEAVETVPEGHASLPSLLNILGVRYRDLFKVTHQLDHIQLAIDCHRKAVEASSPETAAFIVILESFGNALRDRFLITRDIADIDEAIALTKRVINVLPKDHSFWARFCQDIGDFLIDRYAVSEDNTDLESGFAHYSLGTMSTTAPPYDRCRIAKFWAHWAIEYNDSTQAISAFDALVEVVPAMASVGQTVQRRHELLTNLSSYILRGASVAISTERVDKALEWLERGRGLVWSQISSLRTPLDDLRSVDATTLADRFETISRALDASGARMQDPMARFQATIDQKISLEEQASSHVKLAKERESLLKTIRTTIPGFEKFLQPLPSSSWMQNLPESGPVVVINVHSTRCDAIALIAGSEDPLHIPLPDFSLSDAVDLRQRLEKALKQFGITMRGSSVDLTSPEVRAMKPKPFGKNSPKESPLLIEDILRQLWSHLVKPIVEALALPKSEEAETRIWWCPTGPLTFLPLHAAGIYTSENPEALSDYAVSSYIPTVAVLTERVKSTRIIPEEKSGLLLVSQPHAPGYPFIPGTTAEIERIAQKINESQATVRTLRLEDENATVKAGTEGMESYSCVHLACHAAQDIEEPLKSGFYLHDGRLELSAIIKSHIKSADFAFLSACQTSTGDHKLSEEAVHLAAGMLAAGYRGVVATMWSIQDKYAPEVAEDFYADLLLRDSAGLGRNAIDGSNAAYSLHRAVRNLRARHGDSDALFLAWIPYVHFGL